MAIDYAHKIEALIKLGNILKVNPRAIGAAGGGKKKGPRGSYEELRDNAPTLKDIGLDKKISMISKKLAQLPVEEQRAIAKQELTFIRNLIKVMLFTPYRRSTMEATTSSCERCLGPLLNERRLCRNCSLARWTESRRKVHVLLTEVNNLLREIKRII